MSAANPRTARHRAAAFRAAEGVNRKLSATANGSNRREAVGETVAGCTNPWESPGHKTEAEPRQLRSDAQLDGTFFSTHRQSSDTILGFLLRSIVWRNRRSPGQLNVLPPACWLQEGFAD